MKRAERRHQKQRIRAHTRKLYHGWDYDPVRINKWAENRTTCSGPCCGNPRKWFHDKTLQEIKAEMKFKEELDD